MPRSVRFRSCRLTPRVASLGVLAVVGATIVWIAAIEGRASPVPIGMPPVSQRWFKGNLHAHTTNSDGDSTPQEVARWYQEHGYDFLVLTDHNVLTAVEGLNAAGGKFLVVPGEEVTGAAAGKPVHVNGFHVNSRVAPPTAPTVLALMQAMVDRIRAADGVPSINHPNFGWAIGVDDLAAVRRTRLFEVYNGHPQVNTLGGGGLPGLEEVWDRLLTTGKLLYGVAVDDAHHFKRPWDATASTPGHGWVYVQASALEPRALLEALEQGRFYASTGVVLERIEAEAGELHVVVKATSFSKYRVQFVGRGGQVLQEIAAADARYRFAGNEGYVRAKVIESNGAVAWVQPVGVGSRAPR